LENKIYKCELVYIYISDIRFICLEGNTVFLPLLYYQKTKNRYRYPPNILLLRTASNRFCQDLKKKKKTLNVQKLQVFRKSINQR